MKQRTEGSLAIAAAILVVMSAVVDPRLTVALSLSAIVGMGLYQWRRQRS